MIHTDRIVRDREIVGVHRYPLRLEVRVGPDRKLRRDFTGDRVLIGTHAECDLALSDPTVSKQHCEITLVDGGYLLTDLDSTNGTFLGTARLGSALLTEPAQIGVGQTVLALSMLRAPVEIAVGAHTRLGSLVGGSVAMRQVIDRLQRVSTSEVTVLLTGESGTGKEVAARAIHDTGARARGPFVVVDCGALPATLIESELFGHERGAFTGAVAQRTGAFEAATGGTLFLDEVGELPVELQSRLLGALERRTVQRLGSTEARPIDVRVVAATNRDLRREINRGRFREDLYFRLAVVTVEMPPLRDRPEDIPLYVQELARDLETTLSIDELTMKRLMEMRWSGNVRELRNFLERSAALGEPVLDEVAAAALGPDPSASADEPLVPFKIGKAAVIERFERGYIQQLIEMHRGNVSRAARAADIDRMYLLRLLDKYGLRPGRK